MLVAQAFEMVHILIEPNSGVLFHGHHQRVTDHSRVDAPSWLWVDIQGGSFPAWEVENDVCGSALVLSHPRARNSGARRRSGACLRGTPAVETM